MYLLSGNIEWTVVEHMSSASTLVKRLAGNRTGRVLLAAVVWTSTGVVFAFPMATSSGWIHSVKSSLAQWWAWGLLTPLMVAFDSRLPFPARRFARRVLAHLGASVGVVGLYIYLFFALRALLGEYPWSSLRFSSVFSMGTMGWFLWSGLIYWVIVAALQALRYYRQYLSSELKLERLERNYSQARLNALRMQLDPHFLFNALNTISSHVERDPKLTRRMIEHLGDLLRMSIETKDRQEVPLVEELAFLEHYLAIQRIRFGSHLRIEIAVAQDVRTALVPSLILQPLVENAIRHGISRRGSGGTVRVEAREEQSRLVVRVLDDGVGLPTGWTLDSSPGLGLAVTEERIRVLHPNGLSHFTVRPRAIGGTVVEIALPLQVAEEESHGNAAG